MKDREYLINGQPYVFKAYLFIIIGLLALATCVYALSSDWSGKFHGYSYCPDGRDKCFNKFYNSSVCGNLIPLNDSLCSQEFIMPGESLGEKPSWIISNIYYVLFGLLIVYIVLNHLLYNKQFRWNT